MPKATAAPLVLALGIVLLAAGVVLGTAMTMVGGALLFIGLGAWIANLLPGRGHFSEAFVESEERARAVQSTAGMVERMATGMPGRRAQLPDRVHPISAGVKGGIVGGLVMPLPALIYGAISGHGIWYSVNLLAGMALPGIDKMSVSELDQFNLAFLITGIFIHAATSIVVGLAYGVLLPTLPHIAKPIAWGGLLMPVLWTAASFFGMLAVSRALYRGIDWPSFIFSQFIFGVVAALVIMRARRLSGLAAGILAGVVGGSLMLIPAVSWGWLTGHGIWYPANLLAAMVVPQIGQAPLADLEQFHQDWLMYAVAIHVVMSIAFGIVYGLLLPKLPEIPAAMSWGGLLMPVLWTAASYSLMDVVNPVLRQRVDWPWFVVSQFVFGIVASIVVERSEEIIVPPAGHGTANVVGTLRVP
ncbi:MAG TPA: hypothetical protein VGY55_18275 [Pirellulales bacterium]|nr:hypothetical protein [Pirellulales bacterium]